MNNRMLPIGKLFDIEKGALQSTKCTPGDYDFITAAEEWKTHNEYTHECEALIFAAAASGSLGRTHYVDGKFTTSDLCYILTPKNDEKYPLNLSFYHFVFNSLRPSLVAATKSGTSKESINQTNFKNYEIPYFDIELQDFWIEKLKNTLGLKGLLGSELTCQQTLLKKLRQQILQEAIEGKLTADWRAKNPDVEPASELLKRIAAEKAQLVKEKKIKAQKPLPPISDEQKPFELPPSWEWCRLGALIEILNGNNFLSTDFKKNSGVKCIKITNAGVNKIIETDERLPPEFLDKYKRYLVYAGDIVLALTRPYISDGLKVSICPDSYDKSLLNQRVAVVRPSIEFLARDFCYLFLCSDYVLRGYKAEFDSKGQQPNLKSEHITHLIFPCPPRLEQQAIVTKVEQLFALCDQLETQITHNQSHAEQLMQTVLKEAFAHNNEAETEAQNSTVSADAPEVIRA